jgi:hypothetical protein
MSAVLTQPGSRDSGFDTVEGTKHVLEFSNACKCRKIRGSSRSGRVAQLGEHLLCKQNNSQAKSLLRLRLGQSSVPLAAPILLQEISHQLLVYACGREAIN